MSFRKWLIKEGKDWTYVYHVSPQSNLRSLRPRSGKKGSKKHEGAGAYVAPRFQDAVAWATSFVVHKKGKMKAPRSYAKQDKVGPFHNAPMRYKEVTIYKLRIPKNVLQNSWEASWWEREYYIKEEHLDQVEMVSSQTYSTDELYSLESKESNTRHDHMSARTDIKKVAVQLQRTNLAAREYLRLKDVQANLSMSGKVFDEKQKTSIRRRFFDLENLIIQNNYDPWSAKNIERLSPEQERKVQDIVGGIETEFSLASTPGRI